MSKFWLSWPVFVRFWQYFGQFGPLWGPFGAFQAILVPLWPFEPSGKLPLVASSRVRSDLVRKNNKSQRIGSVLLFWNVLIVSPNKKLKSSGKRALLTTSQRLSSYQYTTFFKLNRLLHGPKRPPKGPKGAKSAQNTVNIARKLVRKAKISTLDRKSVV